MTQVVLLGGGNLASHLATAFAESKAVDLIQVYNRSIESIQNLAPICAITDVKETIKEADVYIICVSDNAVEEMQQKLRYKKGLIVHTSGALEMSVLNISKNVGVFYPLQSFTKGKKVDFTTIPFCIEATDETSLSVLKTLAASISDKVFEVSSDQRKKLHVAAVFVNNFVNHMYQIGESICVQNKIPFEILYPLIEETSEKIKTISPKDAQTGPAIREDNKTLDLHEQELNASQIDIYRLISNSILKDTEHGSKL